MNGERDLSSMCRVAVDSTEGSLAFGQPECDVRCPECSATRG